MKLSDQAINESTRLLANADIPAPACYTLKNAYQVVGKPLVASLDLYASAVTAISLPMAIAYPLLAYPNLYPGARRTAAYASIPLCAGALALHVAAKNKYNVTFANRILDASTQGANTFNFYLGFSISVYIAIYAAINNIGAQEVDTSDAAYLAGFILPSAILGTTHAALEMTKHSWEQLSTPKAKAAYYTNAVAGTLFNAGNLNAFMVDLLASWQVSERGNVNPYGRMGLYSGALALGITLSILDHKYAAAVKPINRMMDYAAATTYLREFFAKDEERDYSVHERRALQVFFASLALLALISAIKLTPRKNNAPESSVSDIEAPVDIDLVSNATEFNSIRSVPSTPPSSNSGLVAHSIFRSQTSVPMPIESARPRSNSCPPSTTPKGYNT